MGFVDRGLADMFGYTTEEMIGKSIEMLVPARFQTRHPAWRADFAANPSTRPMGRRRPLTGLRKDGSEFAIMVGLSAFSSVSGLSLIAFVVDATTQRKPSDPRESDILLAPLVEQLPVAIGIIGSDGTWIFRNPNMCRYFPGSASAVTSQDSRRWFTSPTRQPIDPIQLLIARVLSGQAVEPGIEFIFREESGHEIVKRVVASPFRTANGLIDAAIIMIQSPEPGSLAISNELTLA